MIDRPGVAVLHTAPYLSLSDSKDNFKPPQSMNYTQGSILLSHTVILGNFSKEKFGN